MVSSLHGTSAYYPRESILAVIMLSVTVVTAPGNSSLAVSPVAEEAPGEDQEMRSDGDIKHQWEPDVDVSCTYPG
jgi:hypothetical protein